MKKKIILVLLLIALVLPLAGCKKETIITDDYKEGLKFVESRNYTSAIESFEKALAITPDSAQVYLEIAKIYKEKGLIDKAQETLDIGIENSQEDKDLNFEKAETYSQSKDYENAIKYYEKSIKNGYWEDEARINLGLNYIKAEQFDKAIKEFEKIDNKSDYYSDANYYLSVLETEDYAKSLGYLSNVVKPKKENIEVEVSIFKTLLEEINEKSSNEETNPNYVKLLHGYSLIKIEQFELAKNIIQPVASHYEEEGKPSYQANFFLGSIYYHLSDYQSAKTELMTSIVANPTDPITLHLLGLTYSKLNDQVKSIENFEKSIMLDPNNERSRYDFVQTLIKFKINSKAEFNFEELIKLETEKNPQYQLEFAQFLNDVHNNPSKANVITSSLINEWEEFATSSKDTISEIYDTHGWSLYLTNRDLESQDFLMKSIENNEYSGEAYYHLAKVMERLEDYDKAIEYYARAIDLSFNQQLSQKADQEYQRLTQ